MSKNKKPKKKYVPRTVYFPKIVNSMLAFDPLQEALNRLIDYGEIKIDKEGTYIYINSSGEEESFIAGLEIYSGVVKSICKVRNLTADLSALDNLYQEMIQQEGFDEENIINAKDCLDFCKTVISKAPTLLVRDLVEKLGIERKLLREQEEKKVL